VVLIDRAADFLGVPGSAHLALRIAGIEQGDQPGAASVVEELVGLGEQPAGPVERVVLVASVPEGLVLHPAAHLVEALVGQLHRWNGSRPGWPRAPRCRT
jgi:hypothetical protein